MNLKVGFGFDVHQLDKGKELILGGVKIPYEKGFVAHSDGDVLIHSICDALLGAANLRDIGFHFPDTAEEFKGIDSKILLKRTNDLLKSNGYSVVNTDSTICLQKPRIKDIIPSMQKVLSEILEVPEDNISIKATTTEKLGFVGREEGVSVYTICLISK